MRAVCCCHAELWVCLSFLCSLLLEGQLLLEVCRWGGRAVIKRSISASVGARNVNHSGVLLRVTLAFWLACQLCRSQSYLLNEIHLKWMGLLFFFFIAEVIRDSSESWSDVWVPVSPSAPDEMLSEKAALCCLGGLAWWIASGDWNVTLMLSSGSDNGLHVVTVHCGRALSLLQPL